MKSPGKCKGCGKCCNFFIIKHKLDKAGKEWITARGFESKAGYIKFNIPCQFLTRNKECDIWANRPAVCRKYHCRNDKSPFHPLA